MIKRECPTSLNLRMTSLRYKILTMAGVSAFRMRELNGIFG